MGIKHVRLYDAHIASNVVEHANLRFLKSLSLPNRGDTVHHLGIRDDEEDELSDTETDSSDIGHNPLSEVSDGTFLY